MKLMRILLADVEGVSFYFDNILVFSETWQEHLDILEVVFQKLLSAGLTVKPSKCSFGFEEVSYLGFIIGKR